MNMSDYEQYYQKGGTYVLPIELFNELFGEMENWKEQAKKKESNWNSLRELIEDEKTRLAKECSHTYEDSLGKTKYVNEDIFNELDKMLDKMNELEGVTDE